MKRICLIIALSFVMGVANAQTRFTIDSIEYLLAYPADSIVTLYKCHQTTGAVVVPEEVSYYGHTYRVAIIGEYAFGSTFYIEDGRSQERSITSITLPNSIRTIKPSNFNYFYYLTDFTLPSSNDLYVENDCFNYCTGIRSIPNNIHIGHNSFNFCRDLETLHNNHFSYECFNYCLNLTEIVIGDMAWESVDIGRCFEACPSIRKITIGTHVNWSYDCFGTYYWNFDTVFAISCPYYESSWGLSVDSIDEYLIPMDTIVLHGTEPPFCPFHAQSFGDGGYNDYEIADWGVDYHTTVLVVPCNTKSTYEVTEGWNQFYNIVEDCSSNSIDDATEMYCDINIYSSDGRIVMHNDNNASGVIYDMEGRTVETIYNGIPSEPLPNGVYLVRVETFPARKVVVIR